MNKLLYFIQLLTVYIGVIRADLDYYACINPPNPLPDNNPEAECIKTADLLSFLRAGTFNNDFSNILLDMGQGKEAQSANNPFAQYLKGGDSGIFNFPTNSAGNNLVFSQNPPGNPPSVNSFVINFKYNEGSKRITEVRCYQSAKKLPNPPPPPLDKAEICIALANELSFIQGGILDNENNNVALNQAQIKEAKVIENRFFKNIQQGGPSGFLISTSVAGDGRIFTPDPNGQAQFTEGFVINFRFNRDSRQVLAIKCHYKNDDIPPINIIPNPPPPPPPPPPKKCIKTESECLLVARQLQFAKGSILNQAANGVNLNVGQAGRAQQSGSPFAKSLRKKGDGFSLSFIDIPGTPVTTKNPPIPGQVTFTEKYQINFIYDAECLEILEIKCHFKDKDLPIIGPKPPKKIKNKKQCLKIAKQLSFIKGGQMGKDNKSAVLTVSQAGKAQQSKNPFANSLRKEGAGFSLSFSVIPGEPITTFSPLTPGMTVWTDYYQINIIYAQSGREILDVKCHYKDKDIGNRKKRKRIKNKEECLKIANQLQFTKGSILNNKAKSFDLDISQAGQAQQSGNPFGKLIRKNGYGFSLPFISITGNPIKTSIPRHGKGVYTKGYEINFIYSRKTRKVVDVKCHYKYKDIDDKKPPKPKPKCIKNKKMCLKLANQLKFIKGGKLNDNNSNALLDIGQAGEAQQSNNPFAQLLRKESSGFSLPLSSIPGNPITTKSPLDPGQSIFTKKYQINIIFGQYGRKIIDVRCHYKNMDLAN